MTDASTVDSDWGALLTRALPNNHTGDLSSAQRRFLTAIADNDECWGIIGNPKLWLERHGLPTTRTELRALTTTSLKSTTGPRPTATQ